MAKIQSIIMAGGYGDRLWPRSNAFVPKQFIKLFGEQSPLQTTLCRNKDIGEITVMVQSNYKNIAKKQIDELGIDAKIITEPSSKNTAPCAIIAALYAESVNADKVILLPVDHYIRKHSKYLKTLRDSIAYADDNNIVTLGIKPLYPAKGYGYLKLGKTSKGKAFEIDSFIEKPNLEDAKIYIKDERYYWNSGMLVFNPSAIKSIAKRLEPSMYYAATQSFMNRKEQGNIIELHESSYEQITGNSIDYAFMEKNVQIVMLKGKFMWKDVGTWDAVWDNYEKDDNNNVYSGEGEIFTNDVSNSLIHSEGVETAVLGVQDMIIVNTKESSLIMHKSNSQNIRKAKSYFLKKKKKAPKCANDNG